MKRVTILILIILGSISSSAQDVEHLFDRFKKTAFQFSGGISANQVFYGVNGIDSRRSPYTYYLSGNVNASFYGWNFPVSFSFSDQELQYQTPPLQSYNRIGIAPYYKWIKLYAGYSNMTFSPYTLNGYTFSGGGAELTPGKIFNFSAMYGRLHEAIEEDTSQNITAVYKRMGYGFKIGAKKDADFIDLIFFKAEDDVNSLLYVPDNLEIKPGENLVLGVRGGKTFAKKVKLDFEYASSAITRDIRTEKYDENVPVLYRNISGLFTPRVSSSFYNALKGSFNYLGSGYGLGIAYERIDPGYETMGAYYFNNDLENLTINANTAIFKNKIQLAVNFGLEHNNLDDDKLSTMKKTVGAFNVNFSPSAKWNITTSYSNFTSFTNIRSDFDYINQVNPIIPLDTLNFTQITQSANTNVSYLIGDPSNSKKKQFINFNFSAQIAANEQENNPNSGSAFYNGNASYSLSLIPQNMTITTSLNTNYTEMPGAYNFMAGPMVAVSRLFFQKALRSSSSIAWNRTYINEELVNEIINFRINGSYTIKKKHRFNLSIIVLNKSSSTQNAGSFTEFTATLGYSFSFATKDNKKETKKP
ncbi:MAG: hypothetical protein DRJ10_09915 [Bacteroidetes bacterium]|nr:MAG: hypothetical protein DRJ10_09915 [Bacteroidota bacterium]